MMLRFVASLLLASASLPLAAQPLPASLDQLAATPVVTVHISEQLRRPPDEATINASTEAREPTAAAALAANKAKTQQLLAAIRASGIAAKDIQTEGVSVGADYGYQLVNGRNVRRLNGYVARNTVRIKTRDIDGLGALLDRLTAAGATDIYGPSFSIADPAPLRAEARRLAMARGEAEASEYARNAGFTRVRLLSVEEGISYRATDIVLTGTRVGAPPPPPPPPASPERGGIEPGQIETGVGLTLQYRMER
ncbi:MAG: SIMPL domain-containing protein [Sphingomicrobium sp.]